MSKCLAIIWAKKETRTLCFKKQSNPSPPKYFGICFNTDSLLLPLPWGHGIYKKATLQQKTTGSAGLKRNEAMLVNRDVLKNKLCLSHQLFLFFSFLNTMILRLLWSLFDILLNKTRQKWAQSLQEHNSSCISLVGVLFMRVTHRGYRG